MAQPSMQSVRSNEFQLDLFGGASPVTREQIGEQAPPVPDYARIEEKPMGVLATNDAPHDERQIDLEEAVARAETSEKEIEDVGEQLVWNRKNDWLKGGLSWSDIANENETLRLKLATKRKVWPRPDWEKLLEDVPDDARGKSTCIVAYLVKQVYDAIPNKPNGVSEAAVSMYVTMLNEVRAAAESLLSDPGQQVGIMMAMAKGAERMKRVYGGERVLLDATFAGVDDKDTLRPLYKALFPRQAAGARFQRGTEDNDRALQLGNKVLKAMHFDISDVVKAMRELDDGWPGKKEQWERQGYIVIQASEQCETRVIKTYTPDGDAWVPRVDVAEHKRRSVYDYYSSVDSERAAETKAAEEAARLSGRFVLADKRGRIMGDFATREEAVEAARDAVSNRRDKSKPAGHDQPDDGPWMRSGAERRENGRPVSAEELRETFGFRGVNFGKWVKQNERQDFINAAYDALCDLADVMGLPRQSIGLDGLIGLAFGAQGRGGAYAAHFIPGYNEINLTKTAGAGSLAHEWMHALDHSLGVKAGRGSSTEPFASHLYWVGGKVGGVPRDAEVTLPREVTEVMASIHGTMKDHEEDPDAARKREQDQVERAEGRLSSYIRSKDFASRLSGNEKALAALEKIQAGEFGEYVNFPPSRGRRKSPGALSEHVLTVAEALELKYPEASDLSLMLYSVVHSRNELAKPEPTTRQIPTRFLAISRQLDGRNRLYWASPHELFARAGECWVMDRLAEKGIRNDFLVRAGKSEENGKDKEQFPYPVGDERVRINQAFDVLRDTLVPVLQLQAQPEADSLEP